MQTITTAKTAGLFYGLVDGQKVCGPYMNKGMAVRQAKRIAAKTVQAPTAAQLATEAARTEGRKLGMTEAQIERFIARMA